MVTLAFGPTTTPLAARRFGASGTILAAVAATTAEQTFHTLPDGMRLEVLQLPSTAGPSSRPPLLFLHGSFHGAWCWAERFMPFFSAAGYDTYAVSIRAQGGSDRGDLKFSGDLTSHADDLGSVIAALPAPPVLVCHSFGGLFAEKYVADTSKADRPPVAGLALLCAVPPSGNRHIVRRLLRRSLIDSFKITWAFVGRSFARSLDECRFTFFSPDIPLEDLQRYQAQLAAASPARLVELGKLNKDLPLPPLPAAAASLPVFVAGGEADLCVDVAAVEEAAAYFRVAPVVWPRMAHDCMLDTRWEEAAESLKGWLDGL